MGWNYADKLNSLTLAHVAEVVRFSDEGGNSNTDPGVAIPGLPGVTIDPEAPDGPKIATLITLLRYTSSSGSVTHTDGRPGHVFENLSKIKKELFKPATYTRTYPHVGTVVARNVRLIGDPKPGQVRHEYQWTLLIPEGTWRDNTESTATGTPPTVTTKGDRWIHDPILVLSAAGTFKYTDSAGVEYEIEGESGPSYPVTIDVGAGTILDNGAADASGKVTFSHRAKLRLEPGASLSLTSTASATLKWRNRWALG